MTRADTLPRAAAVRYEVPPRAVTGNRRTSLMQVQRGTGLPWARTTGSAAADGTHEGGAR